MPIQYEIVDNILHVTTEGEVEFTEGLSTLTTGLNIYRDTKPQIPRILFNLINSTEDRSTDELKGIAAIVGQQINKPRIAIVVRSNLHYGLSRMFAVYVDKNVEDIKIFRELKDACDWLFL